MPELSIFKPSSHGLHFVNDWPPDGPADYVFNIPPLGQVKIGSASNGLCGGMAFTVADLFLAGRRPPDNVNPPDGSTPLFGYLAARLLASFNIPGGVLTYYYWANTPNHDTGIWPVIRSGLARMTIQDQIPQITKSIDANVPSTIGLVTVYSLNPGNLGECHQVLAYAYERNGARITFKVYDPNSPNNDDIFISLNTDNPAHTTPIDHNVAIGGNPIRGFFYTQYSKMDPTAIAGPPW